ncbi:hypothetical protein [Mesorhizobium xinjiangense]|uniref:hypothetical protein n=1 Tax=Mesorhizobium xinjiangense TaxID=2678685 RepID=UPI0012EE6F24|nr:hypothetical protein [Mesorhizobium xinjiangense]
MRTPTWQWTWNLNTVVLLVGLVAGIAAWGATWERVSSNQRINAEKIERIDKRVTSLETTARILDNHELRITAVEEQANDAADAMRSVESAIHGLSSDMRVVREILQRLENRTSRPPP